MNFASIKRKWLNRKFVRQTIGIDSTDAVQIESNVQLSIGKRVSANISGTLHVGETWPGIGKIPSVLKLDDDCRLEVCMRFVFYTGLFVTINKNAKLRVGSGYMNYRVTVECFHSIEIGNDVIVGPDVVIRDSDNHSLNGANCSAPIVISDNVWIGQRATILKGVTIGAGAVVAAGAVVTKSVPPFSLVGGVPARVIRENVSWQ